jgi:hypothetical protein
MTPGARRKRQLSCRGDRRLGTDRRLEHLETLDEDHRARAWLLPDTSRSGWSARRWRPNTCCWCRPRRRWRDAETVSVTQPWPTPASRPPRWATSRGWRVRSVDSSGITGATSEPPTKRSAARCLWRVAPPRPRLSRRCPRASVAARRSLRSTLRWRRRERPQRDREIDARGSPPRSTSSCRREGIYAPLDRRFAQAAAGSGTAGAASPVGCSPRVLVARSATNADASRKIALASRPRCSPELSACTGATCAASR